MIKSVLILESGIIPPVANFEQLNPNIDATKLKIEVLSKPIAWPTKGLRQILINSFGASRTNAHVVLDDAYHYMNHRGLTGNHCTRKDPPQLRSPQVSDEISEEDYSSSSDSGYDTPGSTNSTHDCPRIVVLSAPDKPALQRVTDLYDQWAKKHASSTDDFWTFLDDFSYTLSQGRSLFSNRSFAILTAPALSAT